MKKTICLTLSLFLSFASLAQTNVDSLVNVLKTQTLTISEKLDLYYKLNHVYSTFDLEKSHEMAKAGLKLAEKAGDIAMASKFSSVIGHVYGTKASYDTAFVYFEKALELAIKAKDKEMEAYVYSDYGVSYARTEQYEPALDYFLKALAILETTNNKPKALSLMTNIASLYRGREESEKALYYLNKAKELAEELNEESSTLIVYFELGAINHQLAGENHDKELIQQALDYELKAYEISHKLGYTSYQVATAQALSTIYADYLHDYELALKYAQECLQIAESTGDPKTILGSWVAISNANFALKRYAESEDAALNAWNTDSTDLNLGFDILRNSVMSNIALGNQKKAAHYFRKYMQHNRAYLDQTQRTILAEIEAKYETQKKETRITTLEKEKRLHFGLGLTILLALSFGIGLLFYRHRSVAQKHKIAEQQIKQLEQEKELIATRSALEAEKTEREIIARDLHDGVGAMLSVVKNNMNIAKSYSVIENTEVDHFNSALDVLDKSIAELRRVAHHIMPATLIENGLTMALGDFCRSIPKVEFHATASDRRFDPEKELVLYRCAYELVNNALRHAGASHIDVHLNMDEKTVYLSIVDNGCGFDLQTTAMGMGINNMRTRLAAFGGSIDIYSEQSKGTEINVELSLQN